MNLPILSQLVGLVPRRENLAPYVGVRFAVKVVREDLHLIKIVLDAVAADGLFVLHFPMSHQQPILYHYILLKIPLL